MKKLTLIFSFLVISASSFAQADNIRLGVKAGVTISNAIGSNSHTSETFDTHTSLLLGGLVEYKLSGKMALQAEAILTVLRAESDDAINGAVIIPLLAKYELIDRLNIVAGVNTSIMTSRTEYPALALGQVGVNNNKTIIVSPFDFGLAAGLEYAITQRIFIDLRANFGLANNYKEAYRENSSKLTRNFCQISLGYKF